MCKDTNLVRLPPGEPPLYQHVLRASLQTKLWLSSNIAKLLSLSPYDLQMAEKAAGPLSVFFEGIMTSGFLQDLLCPCKGKVMCGRSCVCNEQNMCCTELHLYVPVRVAISVWILFREREKMTEILKAAKKTMQISRVFIFILFLNWNNIWFLFMMSCPTIFLSRSQYELSRIQCFLLSSFYLVWI